MTTKRFAAIDIGTNTILAVIAELRRDRSFTVLDDLAEITRLGEGVDHSSLISAAGEQRSKEVLRRYVERCRNLGVDEITVVGTSALRDARNSVEVRARLKQELGLEVRVLSGSEEAAYSYLAVQRGLDLVAKDLLIIDIGGGSTEFVSANETGVYRSTSLDLGSVRLTERYLHSDPVRAEECDAMVQAIDEALTSLLDQWRLKACGPTLVGIAGTFTTLAAVEKRLERYSHREVHGSHLTLAEVRRQVRCYQSLTLAERKSIAGLEPKRADVILAGAYLIERIMTLLCVEEVIVSDQGVRYGLLHERLASFSVDISV
ncbi:MAG TPA: Ppx/GppA phosphatase family protein [Candidatus Binatia bacterium]|nr:Ppx/GppA phosphatase family protein [Candidatus Binatia bacterium]